MVSFVNFEHSLCDDLITRVYRSKVNDKTCKEIKSQVDKENLQRINWPWNRKRIRTKSESIWWIKITRFEERVLIN